MEQKIQLPHITSMTLRLNIGKSEFTRIVCG